MATGKTSSRKAVERGTVSLDTDVVKLVLGADIASAGLTSVEGFVLSRVDGNTTVELICTITGLGEPTTVTALRNLRAKGLVEFREDPTTTPSSAEDVSDPLLGGQQAGRPVVAGQGATPDGQLQEDVESLIAREDADGVDLKREVRLRVRGVYARLREMNFFELLDVSLDADAKAIRRAYFKRSKEFHPDRYYTRNLGRYKAMLAEIFRQTKAAYEFLQDEEQSRAYRATIAQQVETDAVSRQLERDTAEALQAVGAVEPADELPGDSGVTGVPVESTERVTGRFQRARSAVVEGLVQRNLRQQLEARGITGPSPARLDGEGKGSRSTAASSALLTERRPANNPARESRRELDRLRERRQRRKRLSAPLSQRQEKARGFYEQGLRQLEEGKSLAAAASLKLALTYDSGNAEYEEVYTEAAGAARDINADNYFKRAIFEESVGRYETAAQFYQRAADLTPKAGYLLKASEGMTWINDLMKATEYAKKAVQADPGSVEARIALARVYMAGGLKKNARREVDAARKLDPGNTEAKELLKQIKRA